MTRLTRLREQVSRAELRRRAAASTRLRAVRMLWETGPGWTFAVVVLVVAEAVLPNGALVAMGWAVGKIPAAARSHLTGPAARDLVLALVVSWLVYGAALLIGPYREWLSTCVKIRLADHLHGRLMSAVGDPVGIAHLESPDVQNSLAMARGQLSTYLPADAPVALAGVVGTRLGGVGACAVLGTFHWWLGLGMLVVWLAIRRPMRTIILDQLVTFRAGAEVMRRAWYFLQVATKPGAAKELRTFGLGDWTIERYRHHWADGMDTTIRALRGLNRRVAWLSAVVLAANAAACAVLAEAALHHEIGLATLSVLLPLLPATMYAGTITMADIGTEWMLSGLPDVGSLESRLAPPERAALTGAADPDGLPRQVIRFEQVGFHYPGATTPALDGFDLEIPAGQSTAIVGVNGAGKTTLVKLLARLHDPDQGRITVDGTPLTAFDPRRWQRRIAVVFQDFNRYPLPLHDNITLGATEHADNAAARDRAARSAGVHELLDRLEHGYATVLSRSYTDGTDLSGGQWQRVALARALFAVECGAGVLILDEPTAWLDARAEAEFYERFLDVVRNTTSIVISHRFSTVRRADQICVVDGGRVVERGSHDDLMALGGRYAEMFALQAARFEETETR